MLYLLELGPIEQDIAKQSYRCGQPLPERIANAPELQLGLSMYLLAFFDLDSERSHGMGLTRIPYSAIRDYAEAFDFDDTQFDDLFYLIKRMDAANLQRLKEQLDAARKQ